MDFIDHSILKKCLQGDDKQAFYCLYKACYSYMMSIIIRYANGPDDEKWLLNICFSKVALNLHKFDQNQPFKAWMKRVVVNEILDDLRKRKRQQKIRNSVHDSNGFAKNIHNTGEQKLHLEDLLSLLNKLPKQSKLVFNLFVLEGFSHDEIAKKLRISNGTSKWHLSNARKLLQGMLDQQIKPISTQNILNNEQ